MHHVQSNELAGVAEPQLSLWLRPDASVLDLSAAFAGVPAGALEGSGIPTAVIEGPIQVERVGDAADGAAALLTQMCGGKLIIDPVAMLALIGSENLHALIEHDGDEYLPLRAFNAKMTVTELLAAIELSTTSLVNQIAMLGLDLRHMFGLDGVQLFEQLLSQAEADLAWFIDEDDLVHTAQVVVNLTGVFIALFTSELALAVLAQPEHDSLDAVRIRVQEEAQAGRLAYVHASWQTFDFSAEVEPIDWPSAADISTSVAKQARTMNDQALAAHASQTAASESPEPAPAAAEPKNPTSSGDTAPAARISIDPDMLQIMMESSGSMHFVLTDVEGDAVAAMTAAASAIRGIPHPDEPSESLASYVSEIEDTDGGARFWADISDMENMPHVLDKVLMTVASAAAEHVNIAVCLARVPACSVDGHNIWQERHRAAPMPVRSAAGERCRYTAADSDSCSPPQVWRSQSPCSPPWSRGQAPRWSAHCYWRPPCAIASTSSAPIAGSTAR